MEQTTCRMNSQKQAASHTINIVKSKLEVAERLSDDIKNLKEEPSFMTQEGIMEEESRTNEKLFEPKKIIEQVEKHESHPDYLGPDNMEILKANIEKRRLTSVEKTPGDGISEGDHINTFIINITFYHVYKIVFERNTN
jgi:hypothetical protein